MTEIPLHEWTLCVILSIGCNSWDKHLNFVRLGLSAENNPVKIRYKGFLMSVWAEISLFPIVCTAVSLNGEKNEISQEDFSAACLNIVIIKNK